MQLKWLYIFSFLFITQSVSAQHIPRRGALGIHPEGILMRDALKLGWDSPKGARIKTIFPFTTAQKMGLKTGDILLELNGNAIPNHQAIYGLLQPLKAGDAILVKAFRDGEILTLSGTMQAWGTQPPPNQEEVLLEIPFEGGYLRAFADKPKGEGPFPTIYFLQGYPCSSIAFANPNNPFRKLINEFVAKGYAVFRVEKPGIGESWNTPDCSQINFDTELQAFDQAYSHLKAFDFVDKTRIYLYGHSLGSLVAPFLAEKYNPRGVMVYGFSIKPWKGYMEDVIKIQFPALGMSPELAQVYLKDAQPLFLKYFEEQQHPATFLKTDREKEVFNMVMNYDGKDQCINRHYTFWQNLNQKDVKAVWEKVSCPVLSMHGESDLAAINSNSAQAVAELINKKHPGNGTFKLIAQTNHSLLRVASLEEEVRISQTHEMGKQQFNNEYPPILMEWLRKLEQS